MVFQHTFSVIPNRSIGVLIWIVFFVGMISAAASADSITIGPDGDYAEIPKAYEASDGRTP